MTTYIIIALVILVGLAVFYIVSPNSRKYFKWIGAGFVALGGIILMIVTLGRKSKPITEPISIKPAEDKVKEDQAKIVETDKKIAQSKVDAQKLADEAKKQAKANQASTTPDKPGDAAKAADNLNNALK